MSPGRSWSVLCAAFVSVGGVLPAQAHDGPPEPLSLHERADDPDAGRLMATTFGLVQNVKSTEWEVICSEAIGYDEKLDAAVLWSASGSVFVGSLKGLFVSRDGGCAWAPHATFTTRGASDVQSAPGQPNTVFVTTGKFGADNGLFRSDDDGFTFTRVLTRSDTFFTGIRFAPSNPVRAYVSAWSTTSTTATLYRSDDAGGAFAETTPNVPWASGFTIIAVSPRSADELYASVYDDAHSEYVLVRSTDAGANFSEVARDAKPFKQLAFTDGAQTVYAAANRLFRSTDAGATFVKMLAPKRAPCVQSRSHGVDVCASPLLDSFALGRVDANGDLTPTFSFNQVRGILACPQGTQVHDTCAKIWPALAALIGAPLETDGGIEDAGTADPDGGVEVNPPRTTGCGCSAADGGGALLALMALVLLPISLHRVRGGGGFTSTSAKSILAPAPLSFPALLALGSLCLFLTACPRPPTSPPDSGTPDPCSQPNPCTAPHQSECSLVGGSPTCSCEAGYVPDGANGCRRDTPGDCSAHHLDGDEFEPDECPALARDIGGSGEQAEPHSIAPALDADWFRVTTAKGRIFRLRAAGSASPALVADAWMGDPVAQIGIPHSGPEGIDAAWKAPADGTLYFRVRVQDGLSTGPYAVSIGDVGLDDFGDDVASASASSASASISGAIQFNGDADVLSLPLTAGHAWQVQLQSTSATEALTLERLDSAGESLWTASGTSTTAIAHTKDAAPSLFRITADEDSVNAAWTLRVTDLGLDDRGDIPSEAEPLVPGTMTAGTLERSGDRDLFRFDAQATHIYAVTCTPSGASDCLLTLVDSNGSVIASDLDGKQGFVVREFDSATTVTAIVEAPAGGRVGYTFSVEDRGVDDHGDDPFTATDLGMPQGAASGTAIFETPGDRDFLEFTADVDHIYRITCTPQTVQDCNVRVFNANGLIVASDVNGGGVLLLHEYNGGGQYFIELSSVGAEIGTYDWRVVDLLHDDHGDDLFTATQMSANAAWVTGNLESPGDNDWFQIPAEAGHIYRFTCQRVSLPDCELRLYDPQEMLQASDVNGQDAEILFEVGPAQNEFVRVTAPSVQVGTYWIKAEDLGTDDCGDTAATAVPMLANGTPANGAFETPGDVDFRKLTLQAGTTYQLTASGTALAFTLYAPDAVTIVGNGGTPASFTATQTGQHFLEVHALGATGSYSVSVSP